MPSTLTDTQEQVLGLVRDSQQAVAKAVSTWTEQTTKLLPDLTTLPFAELYSQPAEIVDRSFELAEQLLASQREFVQQLIAAAPAEAANSSSSTKKKA